MLRALARLTLLLVLAGSLAGTAITVAHIAADPTLAPFRLAAADEIRAATDRMLAQDATPERLAALVTARLVEQPRNWVALDALADLAAERQIALPSAVADSLNTAREIDFSYLAQAASCAACAYDPAVCSLSQVLLCQAPVALTPIGDVTGVARAGVDYATGQEVDQIDLALSVVGLGATAAVLATGGGSGLVKAGAGLAKLAHKMGRLSPKLVAMAVDAARFGINWGSLPGVRSMEELRAVVRAEAFAPLTSTLTDLDRLRVATNATTALHLLPLVDDAADARRLALAAEALGPKLVGRAEVLGKARLFRATLRATDTVWGLFSGIAGLILSVSGLLGHTLHSLLLRRLRRHAG